MRSLQRQNRVLFLTNHPRQDGSARYRIYQFIPLLEAAGLVCHVRPFSTASLFRAIREGRRPFTKVTHAAYCAARRALDIAKLSAYDLVVIHREAFPFFRPLVEQMVISRSKRVIFSFDDAIYAGHDDCSELNHPLLYRYKYSGSLQKIIANVDHVIAGNSTLAAYAQQFSSAISVIPTVVDLEQYPFAPIPQRKTVTIGWFGSNSTSPYLAQVIPALQQLKTRFGDNVAFRFFGDVTFKPALESSESLPFGLKTEIDDLKSFDIGIMPMPDTPWTRGKCSFKAIQYMALGIPTVVSPVGSAKDVVKNGVTGLWASSQQEWLDALSRLVSEPWLREQLAVRARQSVEQEYSLQRWSSVLLQMFNSVLGGAAGPENISTVRANA